MYDYYDVYNLPSNTFIMRASLAQLSFAYRLPREAITRIKRNEAKTTDLHNSRANLHVLVVPITDGWTPPELPREPQEVLTVPSLE